MRTVETSEYVGLLNSLADDGRTVRVEICGGSMLPFLAPHRDAALIKKPDRPLRCGDIVFCRIPSARGERYILHRISRITDDGFYMIGDAQNVCEGPFPESCVFGVAVSVVRRGKTVTPERLVWKFYSGPWLRHAALRRAALRLRKGPLRRRGRGKGGDPSGSAEKTL